MKRVTILQGGVPEYRAKLFNLLETELSLNGVQLSVVGAKLNPRLFYRDALEEVRCGRAVPLGQIGRSYWLRGIQSDLRISDLVIMPQEMFFLNSYFVNMRRILGAKTAFWGHGRNLHASSSRPVTSLVKQFLSTQVDWWFAYTSLSQEIVHSFGFPAHKITVLNNAIDTTALRARWSSVSEVDQQELRNRLFPGSAPKTTSETLGVFCGRLVPLKWIPFLLESLTMIREALPEFRMIIVGDGPEMNTVQGFCDDHPWCVSTGALHGFERVPVLSLGDIWLNPGMLGLAILDAFALSIPVATTDNGIHSPEIAYFRDGYNGVISRPEPTAFAGAVIKLLQSRGKLSAMKESASETGKIYTLERMVERFSAGIVRSLSLNPKCVSETANFE